MRVDPARPVLLAVGDGGVKTGFARVMESILERIEDYFSIHQLATNYHGDPYACRWSMYPAKLGGDRYGVGRLPTLLKRLRPDLVFCLNDPWILASYLEAIQSASPTTPVVVYSPVDAGPLDPDWFERLAMVKACVVYTRFGEREVSAALGKANGVRFERIPHGVDTRSFFPMGEQLSDTEEARRTLNLDPEDSFIVLNANRNQPRKRIDLTLEGFSRFSHGKPPGVRLFLHMGCKDMGWDLVKLARRYGIEERLIISGPEQGGLPGISDVELNTVYNACDVGLNTSGGEGWGLTSFEHAATGKPQIVPRHSACEELWKDAGYLLETPVRETQPVSLVDLHFTRPRIVAEALERLYRSPGLREDLGRKCFAMATREEYSWDTIARRWRRLFEEIIGAEKDAGLGVRSLDRNLSIRHSGA